jgi:acetyltransferase-like isoleucine patch superfamily enzyme
MYRIELKKSGRLDIKTLERTLKEHKISIDETVTFILKGENKCIDLGERVQIASGAVIYTGCVFGDNVRIGHNAVLRENTKIGKNSYFGVMAVSEGDCEIGEYCGIQTNVLVTKNVKIGNYVFIAPYTVFSNDNEMQFRRRNYGKVEFKGATLEDGVRVGIGCMFLPAVHVGKCSLIAAGSVVTRDVPAYTRVKGVPAKQFGERTTDDYVRVEG